MPSEGGAGRSLVAVIAILAFLAALAAGGAAIVAGSAAAWRASLAREATIQVRPDPGRDVDADVARAADLARATPGIAGVRVMTRGEAERLLEPWLGAGLDLSDLPVPRLVVLTLDPARERDMAGLRERLARALPNASLDDHSAWAVRLSRMADTAVLAALGFVVLVLSASAGAVAFATRGTIAGHRDVVEVLHFVGAGDGFVARLFAWRFARLALRGGLIGAAAASACLLACAALSRGSEAGLPDATAAALFGSFALGPAGLAAIAAVAIADGLVAGAVTALAVRRFLRAAF